MAKDKKSFLIYCDIIKSIDHFTNEEKGILFQHLLEYVNDMNPVLTDRLILTAWKPIENQLKRDLQKYESVRKRNSENALKRWGKKDTKECDRIESDTKSTRNADNDTVNVTGNVNDILLEKETKESFNNWLSYRKEIKKPIKSDKSKIALAKKIQLHGFEISNQVINSSIENSYQGLFWDKFINKKQESVTFEKNR
ncbi:MAG: hypothetical protein JKY54_03070 [Flavobacteriales bacterium]|nr:hypothetical protein [Flavobacteriales bacterium]